MRLFNIRYFTLNLYINNATSYLDIGLSNHIPSDADTIHNSIALLK
ncbi:MAG: hypothetical protein WCG25_04350 [bacterium]